MGKNVIKRYGEGVLFSLMLGSSLNGYSQGLTFDVNAAPKGNIPETLYGVFFEDINFGADGGHCFTRNTSGTAKTGTLY